MESMTVFILLIVFGFLGMTVWLDYRKDVLKIKSGRTNIWDKWFGVGDVTMSGDDEALTQEVAELREQNQQLAERVAILERIVTDSGFELQEKIRKL